MPLRATIHTKTYKVAVLAVLVTLAGCAHLFPPRTPEEQVRARAQERRDAIVKGDLENAYSYFTPGYRAAVTFDSYRGSKGTALINIAGTVESVECATLEKCIAQVKVEIKPLVPPSFVGTITTYSSETWLYEAGEWWFFQSL